MSRSLGHSAGNDLDNPAEPQVVFIQGSDGWGVSYWSWEWNDGTEPMAWAIGPEETSVALTALMQALPTRHEDDSTADQADDDEIRAAVPALAPHLDRDPRAARSVHRTLTGQLASREEERSLARHLTECLLPAELIADIRRRTEGSGQRPTVRVMPATAFSCVPWELLLTAPDAQRGDEYFDQRLIELADIVTVPTPLSRDGQESRGDRPRWDDVRDLPPLRLIDPDPTNRALSNPASEQWKQRAGSDAKVAELGANKTWLSERLHSRQWSRLFFVGHVGQAASSQPGDTYLRLGASSPGEGALLGRFLTAREVLLGNLHRSGDESDGSLWPMPLRVALFACQSGADLSHPEPFGMVTAFLEAGAELVTATRWPLPTDAAFHLFGVSPDVEPFNDAALALDALHSTSSVLTGLCDWQRDRLRSWRHHGYLQDSPLLWAALTNFHAPYRTISLNDLDVGPGAGTSAV